jgi:hypothetical protein
MLKTLTTLALLAAAAVAIKAALPDLKRYVEMRNM